MKSILLEDDVYSLLGNRTLELGMTASALIKEWLLQRPSSETGLHPGDEIPLVAYMRSPQFQSVPRAVDQYLKLLEWLNRHHPTVFPQLEQLPMGGRKYLARTDDEIRKGSKSYAGPKKIPHTDLWALTAMSNDQKKRVLEHILKFLDYSSDQIAFALAEFPDSKER